jgi:hypothetical protein
VFSVNRDTHSLLAQDISASMPALILAPSQCRGRKFSGDPNSEPGAFTSPRMESKATSVTERLGCRARAEMH